MLYRSRELTLSNACSGTTKATPPATGKAPFVVEPRVRDFEFRVLRQNRRVVQNETRRDEIELFHEILTDISMCEATQSVRDFIIAAYVRGGVRQIAVFLSGAEIRSNSYAISPRATTTTCVCPQEMRASLTI